MNISTKDWLNYIEKLRKCSDVAAQKMQTYVQRNGFEDTERLIEFAYALATKYGEGSAELACQMYDAVAEMSNAAVPAAVPAPTATYNETARAVQGSLLQSPSGQLLTQVTSRLVKQAAADTTLQNAIRDGSEWAWIPSGDTCGFCITLASRGWQKASKKVLKGNHASHIHANCDCQFAVRFGSRGDVAGYNPDKYKKMYDEAEGKDSSEKVRSLRRQLEDRDLINAQKRENYSLKKAIEKEKANGDDNLIRIPQIAASSISKKVESGEYSLKLGMQQYNKHTEGTKEYTVYSESRIKKGLSPQSKLRISYEEAVKIIENQSGTGIIRVHKDGSPTDVEMITCDKIIGEYMQKGQWIKTNKAALHHGKKGTHIVPIKGNTYD